MPPGQITTSKMCELHAQGIPPFKTVVFGKLPAIRQPPSTDCSACLQERVYKTKIVNVDELCDRIVNAWKELDQRVIDAAVRQWRACLRACVSARGGNFEHIL